MFLISIKVFSRVSEADPFIKESICIMTDLTQPDYCDEFTDSPTMAPTETPPPPENDECNDAIALSAGETVSGSTLGASFDDVGFCDTINSGPGVWYTVEGGGDALIFDTCDTEFDTRISVFEGGCGALSCVAGNDQANDFSCSEGGSIVEITPEPGVAYHILVHGIFQFAGKFRDLAIQTFTGGVISHAFDIRKLRPDCYRSNTTGK